MKRFIQIASEYLDKDQKKNKLDKIRLQSYKFKSVR